MKRRIGILLNVLVLAVGLGAPRLVAAAEPTHVTAGAGGAFPAATTFANVDVQGLQVAFGAEVTPEGVGFGNLTAVLLGPAVLDVQKVISIQGYITGGTQTAANIAVLTGLATVDLGDGLPPTPDIPFTVTLNRDPATNQGTVGLATGLGNLPTATLSEGSLSIQVAPPEPPEEQLLVAAAGQ
jgi:hypothetical protein